MPRRLLALSAALAGLLAIRRGLGRLQGEERAAALALAAAALQYPLHGLVDYDWDFVEGRAYSCLGRHADAVGAFERSIRGGDHADAWVNLGSAWEALGDRDQAKTCFEAALERDPEDEGAKDGLERLRA